MSNPARSAGAGHSLSDIVGAVATAPVLLVASDFDGTLSELASRHDNAAPHPRAIALLRRLSRLPHTRVAIISGRGLEDLRTRVGSDLRCVLSGSHGAEVDGEPNTPMSEHTLGLLQQLVAELRTIARRCEGCLVERKPRGVAFHFRQADEDHVGEVVDAVTSLASKYTPFIMRLGSMVIEFLTERTTKNDALRRIRYRAGATSVLFIGDDLTDELAFQGLGPRDAGVKVGAGDTLARFRVRDVDGVMDLLQRLAEDREQWLRRRALTPINAHSMLSDKRTIALVDPHASITWLCVPRIDSLPVFAQLLGGPSAGNFTIMPDGAVDPPAQRYDEDALVLITKWPACTVTDYLDCGAGRAFQRAGRTDLVRVIEGTGSCRVRFAPRLDFGRIPTRLVVRERGLEIADAPDPIVLFSPGVEWRIVSDGIHHTAEATITLDDAPIVLELRTGTANDRPQPRPELERRLATRMHWVSWARSLKLPMLAREHVRRSAVLLSALVHGPTGAIAAAATTSLPEQLGGQRNWDYRYCWPRDAAMAAASLVRLGNTGTAMRLLDWLARVLDECESPGRLRPIYTIDGRELGPEAEIGGLPGYGDSLPIRVGNAASMQVQLDVFGPITDLIAILAESGAPISPDQWRMTRAMVEAVEQRWREPDHGIWEIRAQRRHHVHSKAMCFHTVDRAMVVHESVMGRDNPSWRALRETIREDVLAHGFRNAADAFTASYGRDELDASALLVGLVGLVDVRDERFLSTINAVEKHLLRGGTVYRYRYDDGLPGDEGGFHICTGWLIEALARCGRVDDASNLFAAMLRCVGPTGIMAEQHDPHLGIALGNVPQAYSHLALINSACVLESCGVRGVHA